MHSYKFFSSQLQPEHSVDMAGSSSSFTDLLNSSNTRSANPENPTTQHQNFRSHQLPMIHPPPSQFAPSYHPHYPYPFNPFGGQQNYPQFPSTPGSYGSPYQGNMGQYPMTGSENLSFGSMPFSGGSQGQGGKSSRGDESSPVDPSSPVSIAQQVIPESAEKEVFSDNSLSPTEETGKKKGPVHWGEKENKRLVSAWVKNTNDSRNGNDKRGDRYWKDIAEEYNKTAPRNERRTAVQCKNHWNKTAPFISKFNACYDKARREHGSGESDDQVMERAREEYKIMVKKKRPFALEHWWKAVKDQPKWGTSYPIEELVKRTKLNASGSYSTSNADSEDGDVTQKRRPQGRNAARAQEKDKQKCISQSVGGISDESVRSFNELQLRQQDVAEKMAEAQLVQAQAELEKTKMQKFEKYLALVEKDTSAFDETEKKIHDQMIAFLSKELFS